MANSTGADPDIVHEGTLILRTVVVTYTTRQPAPRQWIAEGMVWVRTESNDCVPGLLVGVGASEAAAIHDLAIRFARQAGVHG